MSTFYGGEQLSNVVKVAFTGSSSGTRYTVPNNMYAELYVTHYSDDSGNGDTTYLDLIGVSGNKYFKTTDPGGFLTPSDDQRTPQSPILLSAGDIIKQNSGYPVQFYAVVKEYRLP